MDIYFDTALTILRFIKQHPEGVTANQILENYPGMHRSKLSRYLNKLEEMKFIYRIRTKSSNRGLPPHLWFYGNKKRSQHADE